MDLDDTDSRALDTAFLEWVKKGCTPSQEMLAIAKKGSTGELTIEETSRHLQLQLVLEYGKKDKRMSPETLTMKKSNTKKEEVHLVDIVRHGERLIVPESLSLDAAIKSLQRQRDYDEQDTQVRGHIECFLFEGAWAFHQACAEIFGWVQNVPTPGFFGDTPPTMLSVPISRTETRQVPWGRVHLPVLEGYLQTSAGMVNGRLNFNITGVVKRKYEGTIQRLIERTQELVRTDSIYKGKAFRVRFRDADGDQLPLPEPSFMILDQAPDPKQLIFEHNLERRIQTNIFTMIQRTDEVRRAGVPLKRGILLAGHYGTGKTLVATAAAKLAEANGWTFIECQRADELADVVRLAQSYGRTVVFCEDIDQVLSGKRDMNMNDILNVVDGVDAKSSEIMIVLTTNDVDKITQAMMRPGRIDEVIEMHPPDASAVERLIRLYGGDLISAKEDLSEVSQLLAGNIPSLIRDVVEMSKLYEISLSEPGVMMDQIREQALIDAAVAKQRQMELLREKETDERSEREKAAALQQAGMNAIATVLGEIGTSRGLITDGKEMSAISS